MHRVPLHVRVEGVVVVVRVYYFALKTVRDASEDEYPDHRIEFVGQAFDEADDRPARPGDQLSLF